MTRTAFMRWLWLMLGIGAGARLALAFGFYGLPFDVQSASAVGGEITGARPLEVYDTVNVGQSGIEGENLLRWPYPPGFFPWLGFSVLLEHRTPLPFHGLVQLPMICADMALALLVQLYLGWRGAGLRTRLTAAGAVALGPVFIAISGYHGQLDSLMILPAVLALIGWEGKGVDLVRSLGWRPLEHLADDLATRGVGRALVAGILIGVAVALKTPAILMLVALAPLARSLREAAVLCVTAAAIPLLLLLPFVVADPDGVAKILNYTGAPGLGGLGLAVQPNLSEQWLTHAGTLELTGPSQFLYDWGPELLLLIMVLLGLLILRWKPPAIYAVALVWLTFFVFSHSLFTQYLVWGLPFLLMAGYVRSVVVLQVAMVIPILIHYFGTWEDGSIAIPYAALALAVWLGLIVMLVAQIRQASVPRGPAHAFTEG